MRELMVKEIIQIHKDMNDKIKNSNPLYAPALDLYKLPAEQMVETYLNALTDETLLQTYNLYKDTIKKYLIPTMR